MTPLQKFLAACAALVLLSVACLWLPASQPQAPSLEEALQVSQSRMPMRLYSGAIDPKTGAPADPNDRGYDLMADGRKTATFLQRKDGSTQDTFYQENGEGLTFIREYYPLSASDAGRRIKALITFAADGKTKRSEIWWRIDGTREKLGHLLDARSGRYETMVLFLDGNTAQSSRITEPNPYANNFEPKLIIEKRWLDNARHSLVYQDQLQDDGTRDQVTYDENEVPLKVKHIGRWGKVGTTVKFYFPGTTQVSLESETSAAATLVTAYRKDGSVLYKQQLLSYQQSTTYFDASGKPLYEQVIWTNDVSVGRSLWKVTEVDDRGMIKRELVWSHGKFNTETLYNVTVDGVLYEKVIRTYREEDGTLKHVDMLGRKVPTVSVDYTTADNIRVQIPADELVMPELHDEIPIPEPSSTMSDR